MSLLGFHRFLIVSAILFCLGFAGYQAVVFQGTGETGDLIFGAVFGVLGILLGYYLLRLNRFLGYEGEEGRRGSS